MSADAHCRPYAPPDFAEVYAVISAATDMDRTRRVNAVTLQTALDEQLIGATVAVNQDQAVIGIVTVEPLDRGYMLQGWVHPGWRGQGAGSALLCAAEDDLRRRVVKRTGCIARVYSDIPGVEALFLSQDYGETRRFYNMSVRLVDRSIAATLPPSVTLKPLEPGDLEALVEADNEFFADHWGSQPRSLSEWRYQLIDSRPQDPTLWVIAWHNDKIIGECLCHASLQGAPGDGWIAIVGVRRRWRGRGVGRAVLASGLQQLYRAGFETASLHVDAENAPAIHLYRSLGFEVARTRLHYRKVIIPAR